MERRACLVKGLVFVPFFLKKTKKKKIRVDFAFGKRIIPLWFERRQMKSSFSVFQDVNDVDCKKNFERKNPKNSN